MNWKTGCVAAAWIVSVMSVVSMVSEAWAQTPQQLARSEQIFNRALQAYSEDKWDEAARGFTAATKLARAGQRDPSVGLARFNLAMMMLRAEVPGARPSTALALLRHAADDGIVRAPHALAQAYEQGATGKRDLALSNAWLEKGANLGHVEAQVDLGTNLMLGRGTAKDLPRAAHWFREAAKTGDVGAQYLIASFYEHGDGVPKDLRLAAYWYGLAAANGDEAAPTKFKEIQAQLQN